MHCLKTLAVAAVAGTALTGCGHSGAVVPSPAVSGFAGSQWRLTTVSEGSKTTGIPDSLGARMGFAPGGGFQADDGVNAISGKYTATGSGFAIHDGAITDVGYAGKDAGHLAAIAAFQPVTGGNHVTVVSLDRTRLVTQAGGYRLTFTRTGPATDQPLPSLSSAPTS